MGILETKDKVQRWMVELGLHGIEVTPRGGFTFRMGSTRVFVDFEERGEGEDAFAVVHVAAPFLQNAPASPALYEWVATSANDWLFGHLGMIKNDENGTWIVLLTHVLLADYMDPDEFNRALVGVAVTADKMDDEIAARFGGETFHSDD